MKFVFNHFVFVLGLFLLLSTGALTIGESLMFSLPDGVEVSHSFDESCGDLTIMCPGVSVLELQKSVWSGALEYSVVATHDGAGLLIKFGAHKPRVTILSSQQPCHIVVGVRDAAISYDLDSLLESAVLINV